MNIHIYSILCHNGYQIGPYIVHYIALAIAPSWDGCHKKNGWSCKNECWRRMTWKHMLEIQEQIIWAAQIIRIG